MVLRFEACKAYRKASKTQAAFKQKTLFLMNI
jgi:hypothetical protein